MISGRVMSVAAERDSDMVRITVEARYWTLTALSHGLSPRVGSEVELREAAPGHIYLAGVES